MSSGLPAPDISVGILAPSLEICQTLRGWVEGTGLAVVALEVDHRDFEQSDRELRNLQQQELDIVLMDIDGVARELDSLQRLHSALSESWIFVTSESDDSRFIIEAMRAGAREFLPKPLETAAISEAIQRYIGERYKKKTPEVFGDLLCVIGAKGGCGATSLTINLGASLAELPEERVALVDLNRPLGDLAVYLNLKPQYSVVDALASASRIDAVLLESYMCQAYEMAVLPGKREFVEEDSSDPESLGRMLEVMQESYSHVVVDLMPDPKAREFKTVVEAASVLIFPLTPELPAIWRTKRLLDCLRIWSVSDKVRLVLNRFQKTDEITPEDIQSVLEVPVFWKIPNNYEVSLQAINAGRPLGSVNRSDLSRSYQKLATELTGLTPPKRKLGFLGL